MPDGGTLTTLRDAATYIIRLPKREHDAPEWRAAIEALMLVAEHGGDTMLPRVGIMRALYPDEQRCAGTNVHFGYIVRRAGAFWLTAKGATMAQEADADMVRMNFFGFGFQYYLAGRYAVAAQTLPVAANLLHHAIEMLLKGELTHLDEKQRRSMGHDLTKLWPAYKKKIAAEDTLASFDPVIETLNKFEEIRYPDEMGSTGMHCTFALGKATPIETNVQNSERSEPVYQLFLGDIDALVKAILDKCGLRPIAYYPNSQNTHASTYLRYENQDISL